jgi:O-antigen/teichoic acid export membrane protein
MKPVLLQVLKHALVYGAGGILGKLIGFLMIPVYTRFLSPADYGVIELVDMTLTVLGTLAGYSLKAALVRFYYDYERESERAELVSSAFIFLAAVSLALTLSLFPFAGGMASLIFKSEGYAPFFRMVLAMLAFQMVAEFCLNYLQVKQESLRFTWFSTARLALGLSLNILFVVVLRQGAMGIVASMLVTSVAMGTALSAWTLAKTGFRFSWPKVSPLLIYGYPLIFGAFSNFVLTFSDRYFLNHYTDLAEVGLYSLGYKISMLLPVLITNPFISIWAAKRYEIAKQPDADAISVRVFNYFTLVLVFAALGLCVFAREAIALVAAPRFAGAARYLPILTVGYLCNALYYHFNYGIYLKNKTRYIAWILVSAAVLNTVLNFFLIRSWHGLGAATATALSFLYISVATYVIASRLHKLPYEFGRLALLLGLAGAVYGVSLFVRFDSLAATLACKALLVAAFPSLLIPLGYYRAEEIERIKGLIAEWRAKK